MVTAFEGVGGGGGGCREGRGTNGAVADEAVADADAFNALAGGVEVE